MLHNVKELKGHSVEAVDGRLGTVTDLYFDDQRWEVRYVVVDTGTWLKGRKVLISPNAVHRIAWNDGVLHVSLSQQQVKDSPSTDTDKPVSRQQETARHARDSYYDYPDYREGANLWGLDAFPAPWVGASPGLVLAPHGSHEDAEDAAARERRARVDRMLESANPYLRSSNEVIGYEIIASDGPIGSVENFVFDDTSWTISYMVVDTRKWLPGRQVLLAPECIDRISWSGREVHLKIERQAVETSPDYDTSPALPRETDAALRAHRMRIGYWE